MESTTDIPGVSRRRSLFIWTLCCVVGGAVFLVYAVASLAAGRGEFLMPLDDVYIHFQYARQLAGGQPYIYNPGLPPTSGATSFLYPYLLAVGHLIGFHDFALGAWAMGLGSLALVGSSWLVYLLSCRYAPEWAAMLVALLFPLSGPVAWHYMSGMETGLAVFLTLFTLYAFVCRQDVLCIGVASALALIRPEGGALALLTAVAVYARSFPPFSRGASESQRLNPAWLFLPVAAIFVQPAVNWMVTGSPIASGNASKSVFGMVPPFHDQIVGRIISNAARMLLEFATGLSAREGWYVPFAVSILALVGLLFLLRAASRRIIGLLIVGWLVAGMFAVATLDTAFWHFKRYQMPLMALFFPLAAWGLAAWPARPPQLRAGLAAVMAVLVVLTSVPFLTYYALNANYVYLQPLQMARWLAANAPPDAVVAVHDTGMMRYQGERTTIDIVGLTTPGAADSWRNGPGAVAEMLISFRPDLIASYGHGHGFGLGLLANTSLYAYELAVFPVALDQNANVALAADTQGIYQPSWETSDLAVVPWQPSTLAAIDGLRLVDQLDVADLVSERAHHYYWRIDERVPGFPTEVYEMEYAACTSPPCTILDGGRLINGEESFDVATSPNEDLLLVTRLHARHAGTFDVYANGTEIDRQWIPELPGSWLEIVTLVPAAQITDDQTSIRIVPSVPGGHYVPHTHWAYQGRFAPPTADGVLATFGDGVIVLRDATLTVVPERTQLEVALLWDSVTTPQGDYKVFVHVLDADGATIAQADVRPGGGTLLPGNWLPGPLRDTIMVDLAEVPPGTYTVALGLYEPVTFERLVPSGGDDAARLILGTVEISGDG